MDQQNDRGTNLRNGRLNRRLYIQSLTGIGIASIIGADAVGAGSADSTRRVQADDPAPDPEDYPDILADMDGTGTEEDPYIVTDVVELQAMDGDLDAHFELGTDIDASQTEQWNIVESTTAAFFRDREQYPLGYAPIVEDSETVEFIRSEEELDPSEYTIDYESGTFALTDELPEDEFVRIDYLPDGERTAGFDPVGSSSDPFTGRLNGAGHEIQDLCINRQNSNSVALIDGTNDSAVVENLALENAKVRANSQGAGIVGISEGVILEQVRFDGSVEAALGSASGIVADFRGGEIHEAVSLGTISGEEAGGIVGQLPTVQANVDQVLIEKSYSISNISASSLGGGIVGNISAFGDFEGTVTVRDSYAAGVVNGDGLRGGCAGRIRDFTEGTASMEVLDVYWDEENSSQSDGVGNVSGEGININNLTGLQTVAMQGESATQNMPTLDFGETWAVVTDPADYPILQWQVEGPPPIIGDDPPQDLDGDGLYEDLNGDGEFTIGDVQVFFQNRNSDVVQDNAEFFNFAGNDPPDVSIGDVQALFQLFQDQG